MKLMGIILLAIAALNFIGFIYGTCTGNTCAEKMLTPFIVLGLFGAFVLFRENEKKKSKNNGR